MKTPFQRLRGMTDIVPGAIGPWQQLESIVRDCMRRYGYGEMRTPLLERTSLFTRSIGEATDIVEKEMYSFPDRKGEMMTLRPENTAGCVRAAIENGLLQPGAVHRLWYLGPMFRYERPQLGRQRQFHQAGAEVYGLEGPAAEVELILLGQRLWQNLGIESAITLEINSLGTAEDRVRYREKLVEYLESHREALDEDSLRRLGTNPLRILDSKNRDMQAIIAEAPTLEDSLSDESRRHIDTVRSTLGTLGIDSRWNSRLVRGLDYYSHTVFEWTTERLGAQSAVCAGGRYDGLLDELGARGVAGVGWAFGLERVIALMQVLDSIEDSAGVDVFVVATGDVPSAEAMALGEAVRDSVPLAAVQQDLAQGSLKSQFRKADKSGARLAVIVGEDELEAGQVTVKRLRGDAEQRRIDRRELATVLATELGASTPSADPAHTGDVPA